MSKKICTLSIVLALSVVCSYVLGSFIPTIAARDPFAPAWLKEGTYAKYTIDREGSAGIFDTSDPQYKGLNYWDATALDVLTYWNATLTWRCTSINETAAKLQVIFDYIGKELTYNIGGFKREPLNNTLLQLTSEVYVDLYTRAVYNTDGTLLGTTHLWLPANPTEGQDIVVWNVAPEKITLQARVNSVWFQTIQGKQDGFIVDGTVNIKGKPANFGAHYDLDTGILLNFAANNWEPIVSSLGFAWFEMGELSDTNIQLGPSDNTFNWYIVLQYAILPVAVVALCIAIIYRRKKRETKGSACFSFLF